MEFEVLVVGGGVAGMAAALGLGRSRRMTLVCSGGPPRNAPASHSHNFLTRDGTPPLEILAIARQQLRPYDSVTVRDVTVASLQRQEDGTFRATLSDGAMVTARKVVLATGMRDDLQVLPGLREHWGHSAFACPFCHGWEVRDQPWAVMMDDPGQFAMVKIALGWSKDLLLCSRSQLELTPEQSAGLRRNGIKVASSPVMALVGEERLEGLLLADGQRVARSALMIRPPLSQRSPLAADLGCELDTLGYVKVDMFGMTTVAGVFAVGDMTTMMHAVAMAVASGSKAAGGVHHLLSEEEFERGDEPGLV